MSVEHLKNIICEKDKEIELLKTEINNLKSAQLTKQSDINNYLKERYLLKNFDNEYFKPVYLKQPGTNLVYNKYLEFTKKLEEFNKNNTKKKKKKKNKKHKKK